MRKLVLDLGGVFYSAPEPDEAYWRRWSEACGQPVERLASNFWHGPDIEAANVGQITTDQYYSRASARLDVPRDVVRGMVEELFVGEFNDDLARFVRDLKVRGAAVSALTNSWSSRDQIMQRPEFRGMFDDVISSADVGTAKPDEAIFQITIERLGCGAGDVVFVDDRASNVAAARSLGWRAIQFVTTDQATAAIAAALLHEG